MGNCSITRKCMKVRNRNVLFYFFPFLNVCNEQNPVSLLQVTLVRQKRVLSRERRGQNI